MAHLSQCPPEWRLYLGAEAGEGMGETMTTSSGKKNHRGRKLPASQRTTLNPDKQSTAVR